MTKYWSNYKGGSETRVCPLCKDENSIDNQEHSFKCVIIKKNIDISVEFEQIFGDSICPMLADQVEKIEEFRKQNL